MKIESVEAIPLEMPLKKVFSGSGYRVTSRNTIVTRLRTAGGLSSEVYNGDNRARGREIARIIEDEPGEAGPRSRGGRGRPYRRWAVRDGPRSGAVSLKYRRARVRVIKISRPKAAELRRRDGFLERHDPVSWRCHARPFCLLRDRADFAGGAGACAAPPAHAEHARGRRQCRAQHRGARRQGGVDGAPGDRPGGRGSPGA